MENNNGKDGEGNPTPDEPEKSEQPRKTDNVGQAVGMLATEGMTQKQKRNGSTGMRVSMIAMIIGSVVILVVIIVALAGGFK